MRIHHLNGNIQSQLSTRVKTCLTLVLICLINTSCVKLHKEIGYKNR